MNSMLAMVDRPVHKFNVDKADGVSRRHRRANLNSSRSEIERDIGLDQKVVDLVEETDMASEIIILSLEYDGVRRTANLRPDWTYDLLNQSRLVIRPVSTSTSSP